MPKNQRKINIGIDIDGIFVDKPPLVPAKVINYLYRKTNSKSLEYKIPINYFDKKMRIISHLKIFRPIIKNNLNWFKESLNNKDINIFIVSGRYSFLENRTKKLLKNNGINLQKEKVKLNSKDIQPHIFKNQIIKNLNIDFMIDDDIFMLKYLSAHNPNTTFVWYAGSPYFKSNLDYKLNQFKNLVKIDNLKNLNKLIK
ncbi:hypothetical protein KBB41_00065 [Candidatus Curtissbacteria bacterium]|nr:hypothetical protein [Candidatus Curtissbacteria bacterium]